METFRETREKIDIAATMSAKSLFLSWFTYEKDADNNISNNKAPTNDAWTQPTRMKPHLSI